MLLSPRLVGVLLAASAALAACGDSDVDEDPAASDAGEASPYDGKSERAQTDPPEPEPVAEPPTVIVAGDSMIYDVAPAVVEALSPQAATVVPMVTPSLAQESSRVSLLDRIDELAPDVVVVMVGIWERGHVTASGLGLGDEGFSDEYAREALDPVIARIAAGDGRLLLLGPPHIRVTSDDVQLAQLEQIWDTYARTNPRVEFVDSDSWLIDADVFVELTGEGDSRLRLRRIDGLHLCEEGARRIAKGLVDQVVRMLAPVRVEPVIGWETGSWISRFPADECPPLA